MFKKSACMQIYKSRQKWCHRNISIVYSRIIQGQIRIWYLKECYFGTKNIYLNHYKSKTKHWHCKKLLNTSKWVSRESHKK